MIEKTKTPAVHRTTDTPKSHKYTLDEKRVFIVTPVYRANGESTKEILTRLMRGEAQKNSAQMSVFALSDLPKQRVCGIIYTVDSAVLTA